LDDATLVRDYFGDFIERRKLPGMSVHLQIIIVFYHASVSAMDVLYDAAARIVNAATARLSTLKKFSAMKN